MVNEPAKREEKTAATRPSEGLVQYLARRAEEDSRNRNYEIAASQLDKILAAKTIEEMWDADDFESIGGRDLVDTEMRIESFTVHTGNDQFSAPLGHYLMVTAKSLADGKEFMFNTGAPLLMGKLRWLEAMNLLGTADADVVIKGFDAPNGTVLKLRPVPRRSS